VRGGNQESFEERLRKTEFRGDDLLDEQIAVPAFELFRDILISFDVEVDTAREARQRLF
jgi:hypothetical protein